MYNSQAETWTEINWVFPELESLKYLKSELAKLFFEKKKTKTKTSEITLNDV